MKPANQITDPTGERNTKEGERGRVRRDIEEEPSTGERAALIYVVGSIAVFYLFLH